MPRAKKQEPEATPEAKPTPKLEYDGQYLTDNEEDLEPKGKKQSPAPKRKYRKRTPKAKGKKSAKAKKVKKGNKSKKAPKRQKQVNISQQENQYTSNVLNSATKMKQMLNINKARLDAVTSNENNKNSRIDEQRPLMRPMTNVLDFSKVHFVPKGIINGVKSAKANKYLKGRKYTKRVKLPKSIMDKIKEAQQAVKQDKYSTIIPGYKLGKCSKCGKVHMLPAEVANYDTNDNNGYNSDNSDNEDIFQTQQIPETTEHRRKTELVYTSTTTNGKTTDTGHYTIDNSSNNAIVKGTIKNGKRKELRIPRK